MSAGPVHSSHHLVLATRLYHVGSSCLDEVLLCEKQEYALLDLYFLRTATLTTEKLLYNGLKLFAEIGGYVGLLLGYSFFSLVRWANHAFETMIRKMEGAIQYKAE